MYFKPDTIVLVLFQQINSAPAVPLRRSETSVTAASRNRKTATNQEQRSRQCKSEILSNGNGNTTQLLAQFVAARKDDEDISVTKATWKPSGSRGNGSTNKAVTSKKDSGNGNVNENQLQKKKPLKSPPKTQVLKFGLF